MAGPTGTGDASVASNDEDEDVGVDVGVSERGDRFRIGCDIGGTFTDFILFDEQSGAIMQEKVLTTPDDPALGVLAGLQRLIAREPEIARQTRHVIHGTTLVINAVLERTGARTGLLTTAGFRDVLEMRRYMRADMYDVFGDLPEPLVSRDLRLEVRERIYADGSVLVPLDVDSARAAISALLERGVESIAVSLLHAYANDAHEREIERLIRERQPAVAVSLSSEVLPQIKEYERTSSTVVNAYVKPVVEQYLGRLVDQLGRLGMTDNLFLMLSSGGVAAVDAAKRFPVRLVESGPVAGVLAAGFFDDAASRSVLAFDMGGTTAKAALIQDGQVPVTSDYEVGRTHRFKKGSGIPLAMPAVDIIEVGTGGGSIASVDDFGFVRVGPRSAGASPGPACYGIGGREPTVTDADLLLGYLDPGFFLGGAMRLDAAAAREAIERRVAVPLGLSVEDAAWGIVDVAAEHMANAIKMHVAEKGGDTASASMVAFGGAGPVHAYALMRKLRLHRLILPRAAGVMSALGMLMAPVSFDLVRTFRAELADANLESADELFAALEAQGSAIVRLADPDGTLQFQRSVNMRYAGQGSEIGLPVDRATLGRASLSEQFHAAYRDRYGYAATDAAIEIVSLRVLTGVESGQLEVPILEANEASAEEARKGTRPAYDPDRRAFQPHAVYDRYRLLPGASFGGPAIVEERESTAVIGSSGRVSVDRFGSLVVTRAER
jgi:N-methylhydantoinase A